ncbi:hypothetical protein [Bdellovibrio sp. HCB-162]|uniref:hypothetical protein n=1 Tax=Bdellovibrio sp. HCB-162 TaxID=3394234 RepID=UPI0039BC35B6
MNIFWIEDEVENIVDTFKATLKDCNEDQNFVIHDSNDFERAKLNLDRLKFSILIVDIKNQNTNERDGNTILDYIFKNEICPVIVYTSLDKSDIDERIMRHPLVEYVQKGAGSDLSLLAKLKEVEQKIGFLEDAKRIFKDINYKLLMDWYPKLSEVTLKNEERARLFMRRFAASLDFTVHLSENYLSPWEIYLYPPIPDTSLLTGDILLNKTTLSYVLVLSPSCDLVKESGRSPKIENVLVAKLDTVPDLLTGKPEFKDAPNVDKLADRIGSHRQKEPEGGRILLPRLHDPDLPGFLVDLKKLSLLSWDQITLGESVDGKYSRVASIDSPFRENISSLIAKDFGRLGLPDLDIKKWANDLWPFHPRNAAPAVASASTATGDQVEAKKKINK